MSDIDMLLQQIAIALVGAEGIAAAVIFDEIPGHARERAISKILLGKSRDQDKTLVQRTLNSIEPVRKIRNRFAHGIWGIPNGLPKHLLLTESMMWNTLYGASKQLRSQSLHQEIVDFLMRLRMAEGNDSHVSEKDAATAWDLMQRLSNSPHKQQAFDTLFDREDREARTRVWPIELAWQAARAAEAAFFTVLGLQTCMGRAPEEAARLRARLLLGDLLDRHPRTFLPDNTQEERQNTPS